MDRDLVDRQLMELADHIQQAESEQETFGVEGFGTFKMVQDRLEFVPSDVLATEINNKYAGMKPIELIGAFKEPEGKDIPVADYPEEEKKAEEMEQKELPAVKDADTPGGEVSEVASAEEPPADIPPDDKEELRGPAEKQEDPEESAAPVIPTSKVDKDSVAAAESLKEDPLGKTVVILAVILTLAVAGWLAYDLGLFGSDGAGSDNPGPSSDPPAEQQQNTDQQNPALSNEAAAEETENADSPAEQPDEQGEEGNETSASTVETETYGLYGELNQDISGGFYTIVVHSLRTMELAEEKKQGLVDEGFRTKINEADVNGSTYYRVGIGQFSTIKAAQEAVRELPESYQSNNFINRF